MIRRSIFRKYLPPIKRGSFSRLKILKYTVIIICFLFIFAEIAPPLFAEDVSIERRLTNYGFFETHQEVLDEKNSKINSPEILAETQDRLNQLEPIMVEPQSDITEFSVETKGVPYINPELRQPPILAATKRSTLWDKSTVLEFLLDQPLNYMIMTFYGNHTVLTKGMLRQTLIYPEPDFGPDWGWQEIDVDEDPNTGYGSGGYEIRARMRFYIENISLPSLIDILTPPILDSYTITIEGSLIVEVEKLVNTSLPMSIFFAKYASYEGKNFIINIGYQFNDVPSNFRAKTLIKKIVLEDVATKLLERLITGLTSNITDANLAEISGPYTIYYVTDDDIKTLAVYIAMIRIENFKLDSWTWLKLGFKNKPKMDRIPKSGELWLNNTQLYAPIDTVIWNAGPFDTYERIRFYFDIEFYETRETLMYANAKIEEMPPYLKLAMDYTQNVDGKNITILEYEAEESVDLLEYYAYEYPFYQSDGNLIDFNVSHVTFRDLPFKLRFEITSDVGRDINNTISSDPTIGIMANLIDNIIIRVARRFYRIADSLKTLATSITTLPQRKGWAEMEAKPGYLGFISLYRSSGKYLSMEKDFISFLNQTDEEYAGFLVDFPIAGKITDVSYFKASFKNHTDITLKHKGRRPLAIAFVDGEDFAYAEFSDMPNEVKIRVTDDINTYTSYCIDQIYPSPKCDYYSDSALENRIDKFEFYSRSKEQYMELQITDIPIHLELENEGSTIKFNAGKSDYVGSFEFLITDNVAYPIAKLEGDHSAYIDIQPEYSAASGKLTGLQQIVYKPGSEGRTELRLKNETEFDIKLINNVDDRINAAIILDPLPSEFSMELPGAINTSIQRFPDVVNITGEVDFSNVVFAIANLGNSIINIINNISRSVVELVGAVSTNLSFAYDLEGFGSTLDVIASIERGNPETLPYLNWSHGIIMAAEDHGDTIVLKSNIYLQGLPPHGEFTSTFGEDDIYVDVSFDNYRPKYDWLYIERRGLQNRDMDLYLDELRPGLDLDLEVNFTTNLTIGGKSEGSISILCEDSTTKSEYNLGRLMVNIQRYRESGFVSKTEVFISEVPSTFDIEFSMFRDMSLSYHATASIEFIYVDISKKISGEWYHTYAMLHELPLWFEASFKAKLDYKIDKPLPLQGLPEISISSGSKTMDIIVHSSGRASGQRGNIDVRIENVNSLFGKVKGDSYKITSGGIDYIMIKMADLPLMENFKIVKLELLAENLQSVELNVWTLFGVYPMFEIKGLRGGAFEIKLDHEMEIFGARRSASIALIDVTYKNYGTVEVPSGTPVHNNGISVEMDSSKRHLLVPAPMTSLIITSMN